MPIDNVLMYPMLFAHCASNFFQDQRLIKIHITYQIILHKPEIRY